MRFSVLAIFFELRYKENAAGLMLAKCLLASIPADPEIEYLHTIIAETSTTSRR